MVRRVVYVMLAGFAISLVRQVPTPAAGQMPDVGVRRQDWGPAPLDGAISWQPIIWAASGGRSRAALLVPVRFDGIDAKLAMQLDSAAPTTHLYTNPYQFKSAPRGERVAASDRLMLSGYIAGCRFRAPLPLFPRGDIRPDPGRPVLIGCLGSDFFDNRILLLDFVRQQIAILPEGVDLPAPMERAATFLPLSVQRGHWFVPVEVNGRVHYGYLFDTGSSLATLITTRARWRELTDRTGDEPDNERTASNSWGKRAEFIGAPLTGDLRIGPAVLHRPVIRFESSGLPNFNFDRYPAQGLFGNVIFFDRFTVIVDVEARRFGVLDHRR